MALRGVKPSTIQKRMKAFFYGRSGVGKTTAAISFPKPYLIDTEKGSENEQYVKQIEKNGGVVYHTADGEDLINEVKSLLTTNHPYKTLIIDPLTVIYNDLVEKSAEKLKRMSKDPNSDGTEFGRHYGEANKIMKRLFNLLLRLDMNVIITSHSKKEYAPNSMSIVGETYDCWKKIDYLFDLVFEVQKQGSNIIGIVRKSRIEKFPDGEVFPFSYNEIADRYGRNILEKEAQSEELASQEQVKEITHLIDILKIPDEDVSKWLTKANSETFDEMRSDQIQKCIDHLKARIEKVA